MNETIVEVITYMKTHLSEELTIEDIASHFGYSKFHFSREFKRLTGFSAADFLSSIKIEHAKQALLEQHFSVTDSSIDVGYSSLGTFSTTFAKKTGLSPREYKDQVESLYGLAKEYEENPTEVRYYAEAIDAAKKSELSLTIHYPEMYKPSITFVGLFHTPIPNHKPIVGTALTRNHSHVFTHIPGGTYHLLVCSIEQTVNPLRYFILDDCLRGNAEACLHFPCLVRPHVDVQLRAPRPEDPPILINLPKLLANSIFPRNL